LTHPEQTVTDADRWDRIKELFHAALGQEPHDRPTFLRDACGDDRALQTEVESLLDAHQQATSFGERPAVDGIGTSAAFTPAVNRGARFGTYEIAECLGVGGMGEVYRARDTQLGRDVAIKVLSAAFVTDRERLARFEREARVLAALNHPHIATIYGVERVDGARALVLELVDGETLADRIARGALSLADALPIARQIADALEAAHEKGIVHRDLKPANIKITPTGSVKVLDFGLAKAGAGAAPGLSRSPTVTIGATNDGALLGTAAYMSPEQARGQVVDKRTDIWAFGCVVLEMLTARRAFEGEDATEVLARIIECEPDWSRLPASTPPSVHRLLRRCLQKDVNRRLHDVADARIEIADASDQTATPAPTRAAKWRHLTLPILALVFGALIGAVIVWRVTAAPPGQETVLSPPAARFALALQSGEGAAAVTDPDTKVTVLALSADGRYLAYVGGPLLQLFLRPIDGFDSKPLAGTEGADNPFFSPDGQWLGFVADRKLKKISLAGGAPFTICTVVTGAFGASWQPDGTIIFAPSAPGHVVPGAGLLRVSAEGGSPAAATAWREEETGPRWPEVLPGGKMVLYSASPSGTNWSSDAMIYIQSLDSGERRPLVKGVAPHYLPTGHLVYTRSGTVFAVRLDLARPTVLGNPVPVLDGVQQDDRGGPQLSISQVGSIVYVPSLPPANRTVVWVDRGGAEQALQMPSHAYSAPRLSNDGRRLAVLIDDERRDIWMFDLSRRTLSRLTSRWDHEPPIWTPDGHRLTFRSGPPGTRNIYWMPVDGSRQEERLLTSPHLNNPSSWSPDGRVLAFYDVDLAQEGAADFRYHDIWWISLDEPDKPHAFLETGFLESAATFSPDGRWLAYVSNESGRNEIYVRPFPGPGEKLQVSAEGGGEPVWPRNAHELFFRNGDAMFAVDVKLMPTFSAGPVRRLFEGAYGKGYWGLKPEYDVTPDGQRFVMVKTVEDTLRSAPINIVVNWFEELQRRVPDRTW
jgi:eukaryotic-like serine/threonine-protein kinase